MTATLAAIWRHPIKGHGRERLASVLLTAGTTLPWDRTWAVLREGANDPAGEWVRCNSFTRGASAPQLMAITTQFDDATGRITLYHPDRSPLTFDPDGDCSAFLDWVRPLMPEGRAAPVGLTRAGKHGLTDSPFPSISICNLASRRALSDKVGQPLSEDRFRANLWLDGLAPWEEFDLVGRILKIGDVQLDVRERITRCRATEANPETGIRDVDTLQALDQGWGHKNFGVYATVRRGGTVQVGDSMEVV